MSTPTKEDLPKIADTLKNELESEHNLKHADTQEKVVLPSKEEIDLERGQQLLRSSIESFESSQLKHASTQEKNPLPTKEVIEQEKATN